MEAVTGNQFGQGRRGHTQKKLRRSPLRGSPDRRHERWSDTTQQPLDHLVALASTGAEVPERGQRELCFRERETDRGVYEALHIGGWIPPSHGGGTGWNPYAPFCPARLLGFGSTMRVRCVSMATETRRVQTRCRPRI